MLSLSLINPLRYTEIGYSDSYNTKYFDLYQYVDTIRDFEEQVNYFQPFCLDDPLVHQVIGGSIYVPDHIIFSYFDCAGQLVHQQEVEPAFTITYADTGGDIILSVYNNTTDLNDLGEGTFYSEIFDGNTTIRSNKFTVAASQPGTILVKYRNYKRYFDAIFEKDENFYFYLRTQGYITHNLPERLSTTYEDQVLNMTALKNVPYNSWSFITDSGGIPTYMIDLLNHVFGCSELSIDGRLFTAPQDAKWEEKAEEFYPLRGWGIDLREKILKTSLDYNSTTGTPPPPPSTIHDINSDWWTTTAGTHTIPRTATGYKGTAVSSIYKLVMVSRSGNTYRVIDSGTPANDEVKLDGTSGIVFDSALPFNPNETVTAIFEVV